MVKLNRERTESDWIFHFAIPRKGSWEDIIFWYQFVSPGTQNFPVIFQQPAQFYAGCSASSRLCTRLQTPPFCPPFCWAQFCALLIGDFSPVLLKPLSALGQFCPKGYFSNLSKTHSTNALSRSGTGVKPFLASLLDNTWLASILSGDKKGDKMQNAAPPCNHKALRACGDKGDKMLSQFCHPTNALTVRL